MLCNIKELVVVIGDTKNIGSILRLRLLFGPSIGGIDYSIERLLFHESF